MFRSLKKAVIERAMKAQMSERLGYESGESKPAGQLNQRNGAFAFYEQAVDFLRSGESRLGRADELEEILNTCLDLSRQKQTADRAQRLKLVCEQLLGNPIDTTDPTGEFGVVGADIGAGLDLAFQMFIEGKSLKCVNWGQVGMARALGAIGGGALSGAFKLSKGSMKASNALRRYRRGHQVPSTHDIHHWAIEKGGALGKRLPDSIVNHPANLNPVERGIHQGLHNEFGPLGRWWYGTPEWAKAAEVAVGAGVAAEVADDECGCQQ